MAIDCQVSKHSIHKFIKWAKSAMLVATRKTTRGVAISVLNYAKYQSLENYKSDTKSDTFGDTGAIQGRYRGDTINKKDKNEKNEKKTHVADAIARPEKKLAVEEDRQLAMLLAMGVWQTNPAFALKNPNIEKFAGLDNWSEDIEKLRRIDHVTDTQIAHMIKWLMTDESESAAFWRKNIQSGANLRRHWQKLVAAVRYENEKKNRKSSRAAIIIS